MRQWGMTLPGLGERGKAIAQLPALGLLTLAAGVPEAPEDITHPHGGSQYVVWGTREGVP